MTLSTRTARTSRTTRTLALIGAAGMSVAALAGCSSSPSTSASPSASPVAPSSASPSSSGLCSSTVILNALPQGSDPVKYDCETVGGTEWAAVEVTPGPTVFFLQESKGKWDVIEASEICGTASAGLGTKLLSYCNIVDGGSGSASSSASPS